MTAAESKVTKWLGRRGYVLVPGRQYSVFPETKQVHYRRQDPPATRLHYLLHECGHVLAQQAMDRRPGPVRFTRGYFATRAGKARTLISSADLVHEEIEAWHRGHALAARLHIRLDEKAYWRLYGQCIQSYFRAALKKSV